MSTATCFIFVCVCVCVCLCVCVRMCVSWGRGWGLGEMELRVHSNDSFSLYTAVSHMAHVLVYYTLSVVIIICIMFVKLRKCWRMQSAVSLGTPENSAIQKLSIIINITSSCLLMP